VGSAASPQSTPVADRSVLDARFAEVEARYAGEDVPRPPHWGGFRVTPTRVELWQGATNRVHDRLAYIRQGPDAPWVLTRLAP
jgi:pyridoxamine 5'-phosphate oxidase